MKFLKQIKTAIYLVTIIVLIMVVMTIALSVFPAPGGYRTFVVQSGSMEPAVKTGSVVIISPQETYQIGDVITFQNDLNVDLKKSGATTTHRITEIKDDEGRETYVTKGDANDTADRKNVANSWVLGKMRFTIPYLGFLVAFTQTQLGFVLLVVIPGTLIIYSELQLIRKEISKFFNKKKTIKESQDNEKDED